MPRKKGSQNADFAASRQALVDRLRQALHGDHPPSSLRGLAEAAAVTVPTLRHYFGDREEVLAAVFADCHAGGRKQLAIAETPSGPFPESIRDAVCHVAGGFRHGGLTRLHAVGLAEGLGHSRVAEAYLAEVLEPTVRAAQRRLDAHVARGEMKPTDTRHAAFALIAPILLLFLHQDALTGATGFPADIDAFLADHVAAFLAAHSRPAAA